MSAQARRARPRADATRETRNVMTVPFYRHGLDESYAEAVANVLRSPFLTSGAVSKAVEAQLCAFFDVPHAILVNSWTNGAVAALMALGVGPGDEVIVPAMTFIATANVAELVGAKPVFVDVDPATLMLTPQSVHDAVSERTRAVIPVHLYGQMCDVRALRRALGKRTDIAIIEDCAHSFESSFDGQLPGEHSDAAIFSFYATKNVTCGEGGAIICRSAELFEAIAQTRLHGMSAGAIDRFASRRYRHWDMVRLGTKANLPDLLASLLPPPIATIASGCRCARLSSDATRRRSPVRRSASSRRWPAPCTPVISSRYMFHRGCATASSRRSTNAASARRSTIARCRR